MSNWDSYDETCGNKECNTLKSNNSALKSEVERLKVELKEAQAAAAVMREALEPLFVNVKEFSQDWRKGDFELTDLAACDMRACEGQLLKAALALYDSAGTAFLARMAEAERLLENNNSHHGESAAWNGLTNEPLNRAAILIVENDAWLKGGVK